jgi:hypothetical protein
MKIEISEATILQLNWLIAQLEGFKPRQLTIVKWSNRIYSNTFDDEGNVDGYITGMDHCYSDKWAAGGPIIEREGIDVCTSTRGGWIATLITNCENDEVVRGEGETFLIAAMRCYVASKLGDTVDVPKELL